MRRVHFGFTDRMILIPNDFIYGKTYLLAGMALVLILSGLNKSGLSFQRMLDSGPGMMMNVLYAYISGIVLTPMMLPWIPGRPFALKGFITGFGLSLLLLVFQRLGNNYFETASWFLMITGLSSLSGHEFYRIINLYLTFRGEKGDEGCRSAANSICGNGTGTNDDWQDESLKVRKFENIFLVFVHCSLFLALGS